MSQELIVHIGHKDYFVDSKKFQVLRKVEFQVRAGEFVSLLGPSGCGKSTLLRLIAGLDNSFQGRVILGGRFVKGPGRDRGLVFQEPRLLPWRTVEQNVEFAVPDEVGQAERQDRVDRVLSLVGLLPFAHAWPAQLSGGMAKRVAFARALVNTPALLLLDEPFSGLDGFTKLALQEELARIVRQEGITTLLVTHDLEEALSLSDRIGLMAQPPSSIRGFYNVTLDDRRENFSRLRSEILDRLLRIVRERGTDEIQHYRPPEPF